MAAIYEYQAQLIYEWTNKGSGSTMRPKFTAVKKRLWTAAGWLEVRIMPCNEAIANQLKRALEDTWERSGRRASGEVELVGYATGPHQDRIGIIYNLTSLESYMEKTL